jgi:trans-aconitate 2-methyltransferase
MQTQAISWDGDQYARLAAEVQSGWADQLTKPLIGERFERIIDVGCGPATTTMQMIEKLGGKAYEVRCIELDASMAQSAFWNLRPLVMQGRADVIRRDVLEVEGLNGWADLIVSNSALHWVTKHEKLWSKLYKMLRPGGKLCVQLSGTTRGVASLQKEWNLFSTMLGQEPYSNYPEPIGRIAEYPNTDATKRRLRKADFSNIRVKTERKPVTFRSFEDFDFVLRTLLLEPWSRAFGKYQLGGRSLWDRFVLEYMFRHLAERKGNPTLDFVLQFAYATKPEAKGER